MDITEQSQSEKDAVIRTNMRSAIKRARDLKKERDTLIAQLKAGMGAEAVKEACGEQYESFVDAINYL